MKKNRLPSSQGKADVNTSVKTFIGEQRVPSLINDKIASSWSGHTSMFGEDLHWWRSLNGNTKYTNCSSFQSSSMAAIDITANGSSVKPYKFTNMINSGQPVTGSNGFQSYNCDVSIYQEPSSFKVQHNLGFWSTPAINVVKN